LRGIGYEKHSWLMVIGNTIRHNVSIPLRGIGYEKREADENEDIPSAWFPSPCGELVMKNGESSGKSSGEKSSFHPLAGNWL
jgi:hypothetical protein